MLLNPTELHNPRSLDEAAQLLGTLDDVKILAGGTFLMNSLKLLKRKGSKTPQNILSLSQVEELKGVERNGGQLIIRAMTTISDLAKSKELTQNFAILKTVCKNISTQPIRNMATVGGNLTCRYTWTEMGAVMIALNANMHFHNSDGSNHTLTAEEFFQNKAKSTGIFTHVSIPEDNESTMAYRRIRKTLHVDIPLLTVSVRTTFQNNTFSKTRISINNGSAFAQRDSKLEEFLNGKAQNEQTAEEALDHLTTDIYDKRSDEYKQHMFRVCIKSALLELITGQAEADDNGYESDDHT